MVWEEIRASLDMEARGHSPFGSICAPTISCMSQSPPSIRDQLFNSLVLAVPLQRIHLQQMSARKLPIPS